MKVVKRNLNKGKDKVFVVTRGDRRVEDKNYTHLDYAMERGAKLIKMLKEYSPHEVSTVKIVETTEPRKIF